MRCSAVNRRSTRVALLVLTITSFAVAGRAQDQAPAAGGQQAEQPSMTDRVVKWIQSQRDRLDQLSESRAQNGPFPRLGVVTAGSGLAGGGGFRDGRIIGSPIGFQASGIFSYRGYEEYELLVGLLERQRDTLGLGTADAKAASMFRDPQAQGTHVSVYADLRSRDYPRQAYYGIGPDSRKEDNADFLVQGASYEAVVQFQPTPRFGIAGRAGVLDLRLGAGHNDDLPNVEEVFTPETAPGLSQPPQYLTLGAGAAYDARAPRTDPHSGYFVAASLWRFDARDTSAFDFTRVILDGRSYFTPFHERGVLAVRALLSVDRTDAGAQVPFYLQQALGGGETLRGYPNYRFRDLAVACASAEYRWQIIEYVDVGPFVDVGTVGPSVSRLSGNHLIATGGVRAGLRYGSRALFHFDWGFGREGTSLTAGTGVVF